MKLKEYIEERGTTAKKLAAKCGIPLTTFYSLYKKKNMPRLDIAMTIQSVTGRRVTCEDILLDLMEHRQSHR
jgi:AcrR family transcriptional regulator